MAGDLRRIYGAATAGQAAARLDAFEEKWAGKYASIAPAWRRAWQEVIPFFAFDPAIRQLVILPAEPVYCRATLGNPSTNRSAESAIRSCVKSGRVHAFTSRNEDAQSSSVASIEAPIIHDLRSMETRRFRSQTKAQL